jgi:hypothetical protein
VRHNWARLRRETASSIRWAPLEPPTSNPSSANLRFISAGVCTKLLTGSIFRPALVFARHNDYPPQQDLNLGIDAIVDGGATTTTGAIQIDISQPGTHTIEYVATNQNALEGTATRTVDVTAPTASAQSPAATSTNPSPDNPGDTATSTQTTSTAQ